MHRRHAALLVVAALAFTAGCTFLAPTPDSYTASYEYTVGIETNATLTDVTVRVPLPDANGEPEVDAVAFAPNETIEDGVEARVQETDRGPMLELTTSEFTVTPRYYRVVERDGLGRREEINESVYDASNPDHQRVERRTISADVSIDAEYPVETRSPVGSEPVFYPDAARTPTTCPLPTTEEATCYAYDAPVSLAYDAPATASVDGVVTVRGANEWFAGGWTGNDYTDRVRFSAVGPRDGWLTATGTTETGSGSYPIPER